MRYFRHISSGCIGEYHDTRQLSDFVSPKDWEEVIVTPKSQPKTFKKRLCLAIHKHWLSKESFDMAFVIDNQESLDGMRNHDIVQLTEWVEVDFVEKV